MPRIIKNRNENVMTHSVLEEDLNDFLDDPELFRDPLPQPYRRIDRILEEMLDETWDTIENKENQRNLENAKYRPNTISKLSVIESVKDFNCISESTDEKSDFLFIGSNGFLTCVESETSTVLDRIEITDERIQSKDETNITSISSSKFNNQVHFVVAISDAGCVFMYLFCMTKFYQIGFEMDAERKFFYRKCVMAKNCTYIALFLEQAVKSNTCDCMIEVYKCPKDLWAQYVENLYVLKQEEDTQVSLQQLPHIQKPNFVCKIKPPANLLKTSLTNFQNINHLLKMTESAHPEVIGLGINNCFTKSHLDLKTQTFEKFLNIHLSEEIAGQITGNFETDPKLDVEIQFMYSNRLLNVPTSYDQLVEIPNGIAVCWNKSSQVLFYPFIRLTKDLESRCEYSMPFSSQVMAIELSPCNTLIAFVLKNNNLVVFDLIAGIDRCCVYFKNVDSIKRIYFMPPPLPANKNMLNTKTSELKIPTKIICLLSNGEIHIVDCTMGCTQNETIFTPNLGNKDDLCIDFFPCVHLPNLMIALSITNKLFVFDMSKRQMLLELGNEQYASALNSEYFQCSFTSKNQLLYMKAQSDAHGSPLLICHSLKLIPQLEDYFAYNNTVQYYQSYLPCRSSLNDRIKILMEKRIDEQSSRKDRLKKMWGEVQAHRNI